MPAADLRLAAPLGHRDVGGQRRAAERRRSTVTIRWEAAPRAGATRRGRRQLDLVALAVAEAERVADPALRPGRRPARSPNRGRPRAAPPPRSVAGRSCLAWLVLASCLACRGPLYSGQTMPETPSFSRADEEAGAREPFEDAALYDFEYRRRRADVNFYRRLAAERSAWSGPGRSSTWPAAPAA